MADNPPAPELIAGTGAEVVTLLSENCTLLEQLGDLVDHEHPEAVDSRKSSFWRPAAWRLPNRLNPRQKTNNFWNRLPW